MRILPSSLRPRPETCASLCTVQRGLAGRHPKRPWRRADPDHTSRRTIPCVHRSRKSASQPIQTQCYHRGGLESIHANQLQIRTNSRINHDIHVVVHAGTRHCHAVRSKAFVMSSLHMHISPSRSRSRRRKTDPTVLMASMDPGYRSTTLRSYSSRPGLFRSHNKRMSAALLLAGEARTSFITRLCPLREVSLDDEGSH